MGALWEGPETPKNQRNRFRNRLRQYVLQHFDLLSVPDLDRIATRLWIIVQRNIFY